MSALIDELKSKVIETLRIPDVTPGDIADDEPMTGGELSIDSVDILELVVMLENDYGVKIDSKELGKQVFATFASMAEFVGKTRNDK